ncbi:uncharacterized protein [Amphiura filiformis]|uniref:uncharacterized protein n=1 Tax=Amphiura filiformis TaxID=82378 RepID=UPI003B20C246
MMATKVTDASLKCSICLRRFRKPRTLPCLHSYCEECLKEYAPSGTPILMCPLCQEKIKIPDGDVRKFKLDFRLQSMVEDAHRYEREAGVVSEVQVCNCCKDEGEAIAKCEMCKQILCKFGLKAHENLAGLRDHIVKSLTDDDILTSGNLPENQTEQTMANPDSIDQGEEEEEEEEVAIEKRAILISNLPRLQYSPQRIRYILTIHFQKKRNGGGDVDRVLYPLGGCPQHAIVIFTHRQTCDSVLQSDQHLDDFQIKLLVEPFPQPYKTVAAQFNTFYWNLVPRLTTTKLIDEISKMLGKHNLQVRGNLVTEVTCTMNQLDQVQSAIINAVALPATSHGNYSAIECGIFIKNIPYLTDETQQLRDELKKHLEIEGVSQLQTLVCPIKGNAGEAIAIFKTSEDRDGYLVQRDKTFFGEPLDVVKLPAVFNRINARLEDFFVKILKHLGIESLRSKLQSTCGQDLAVTDTDFTGNAQHLRAASTTVLEIISLSEASEMFRNKPSLESTVQVDSTQTETKTLSDKQNALREAEFVDPDERSVLVENIPVVTGVGQLKDHLLKHFQNTSNGGGDVEKIIYPVGGAMDKAIVVFMSTNDMDSFLVLNSKRETQARSLGKELTVTKLPPVFTDVTATCDAFYFKLIPKKAKDELQSAMEERGGSGLTIRKNIISGSYHQVCEGKNVIMEAVGIDSHVGKSCVALRSRVPELKQDLSEVEELQTRRSTDVAANHAESDRSDVSGQVLSHSILPTSKSTFESPDGLATTSSSQEEPDVCAEVDEVIFKYVTQVRTEEYEAIGAKHDVSITAKRKQSLRPRALVVEVKKKTRRKDNSIIDTKKDFIKLYSETMSDVICKSLDCSGVSTQKRQRAIRMIGIKFKDLVFHKESEKMYIFCGKEATVTDGMDEFRAVACMNDEENQPLSVDKITFQYLKQKTTELDDLGRKYNVYFDLMNTSSNTPEQQEVYIKPLHSGKQKKKVKAEDIKQAKEDFISLYQTTFYAIKRIDLTCRSVLKEKLTKAVRVTKTNFPDVLIIPRENNDYMLCGKETVIDGAVNEFRRAAGLLPPGRKQKKTNFREDTPEDDGNFDKDPKRSAESESHSEGNEAMLSSQSAHQKRNEKEELPYTYVTNEGIEIIVLKGDITKQEVNVIVNAANNQLNHSGGVAKVISIAAGPKLQNECDQMMRRRPQLQVGECVTTSGYDLHCDYVIHTVGPFFNKKLEKDVLTFVGNLRKTFLNVLIYADGTTGVRTIAVPLISSGNYGGPKEACTEALALALSDFSQLMSRKQLQQVFLVNIDSESTDAVRQSLGAHFPSTLKQETTSTSIGSTQYPQFTRSLKTREGLQVVITTGDITTLKVDAIVNAANGHLRHGRGVAAAIATAAGPQLTEDSKQILATRKQQPLQVGDIVETGAYQLPCKTVIHAVGPRYKECPSDDAFFSILKQTCVAVLSNANARVEAASVALPLISSGIFGGPKELCSKALVEAVQEFSENTTTLIIRSLLLINRDHEATKSIDKAFETYLHIPTGNQATNMTSQVSPRTDGQFVTSEGIHIYVQKGDITQQVVDAIINPSDSTLSHKGGVSEAILKAAGDKYKEECRDIIKHRGFLKPNEVVYTSSGNLPNKFVLHVSSPQFNSARPKSENSDALKDAIKACMRTANHSLKLTSLALPLLGSGKSGAPTDVSILALVKAIEEMGRSKTTKLVLRQLTVVCIDDKTVQDVIHRFQKSFKAATGNTRMESSVSPSPRQFYQGSEKKEIQHQTTKQVSAKNEDQFVTSEGIHICVQEGDITKQVVDAIINPTDSKLTHADGVSQAILKAAGDKFKDECREQMKHRSHLTENEVVHTGSGNLPSKLVLNVISPVFKSFRKITEYCDALKATIKACLRKANRSLKLTSIALPLLGSGKSGAPSDLSILALAKAIEEVSRDETKLVLRQITVVCIDEKTVQDVNHTFEKSFKGATGNRDILVATSSKLFTSDLAKAIKRFSKVIPDTSFQAVVGFNDEAIIAKNNVFSKHLKPIRPATANVHPISDGSSLTASRQTTNPQNPAYDQSYHDAPKVSSTHSQGISSMCQKCYKINDLRCLESCKHILCPDCIQRMSLTSACPICNEFYCTAEEKTLNGKMTSYRRSDIHLQGSTSAGAIFIVYDFPPGMQGSNHPRPAKPYKGTRALAYLPSNSEGFLVVRQLREAFIAGLTFTVKSDGAGGHEVGWSDKIPHKRNTKGGKWRYGFPDPDYMDQVKAALDKALASGHSSSAGKSNQGSGSWW